MIDRATIDKIMDATNIVDVVGDFVALSRRGADYVACCPFHNERTPSFHVSPSKGIFKCFGCGMGGNAVTFLREHAHMSYPEAIKYLGNKYGIEVQEGEETLEEKEQRQKAESMLIINEFAQKYFSNALLNTEEGKAVGLSYFHERGFTPESISKFLLGYGDRTRDSFSKEAVAKGYKKELLTETGVCISEYSKDNPDVPTGGVHDRFIERVIFPIRGLTGRVVAFGGRKLRSDNNLAKYVNSPESAVYVKNKTLYGLFEAKNSIVKKQNCYLVEGYTDVISFHQKGVENVVASCGTSLTTGQIQLLKRFTPKVTVLYDGDAAGIHASLRGIDMFLAAGLEVRVALFPDGEDPDSFARAHSAEELEKFLTENEEDFIKFKCRIASSQNDVNDPIKRANLINQIAESIAAIPDPLWRQTYMEQTSADLRISEELLAGRVKDLRNRRLQEQAKERSEAYNTPDSQQYAMQGAAFGSAGQNAATGQNAASMQNTATEQSVTVSDAYSSYKLQCSQAPYKIVETEKNIIYYLVKYGQNLMHVAPNLGSSGNAASLAQKPEQYVVAEYIKNQLAKDGLQLKVPVHKKIFEEYFALDNKASEFAIKSFMVKTGEDTDMSEAALDIFERKHHLRSNKIKGSLLNEVNLLGQLVPKTICLYKAEVVASIIDNLAQQMNGAHQQGDTQEEDRLLKLIGGYNKVKSTLLQTAENI